MIPLESADYTCIINCPYQLPLQNDTSTLYVLCVRMLSYSINADIR